MGHEFRIDKGFAANYRPADVGAKPRIEAAFVRDPRVHPQIEMREAAADSLEGIDIAALALDRIQVGDIERTEGVQPQQRIHDRFGVRAFAKARLHRPVLGAPTFARMHYHSTLEVYNRN